MAGLTSTGLQIKSYETIIEGIDTKLVQRFGTGIRLTGVLGKLRAIVGEVAAELWELAEAVHSASNPDANTGASQEAIAAITGSLRDAAASSTVELTLTGTPTTVVPTGSRASVTGTEDEFETLEDATFATATAWAPTTVYVVGNIRRNASRIYLCIVGGTSAGSGGPTTTSSDITDGSVHWKYLGEGTGYDQVDSASVDTGPIAALSGAIITIETPVAGWSSVINILDADLGHNLETDEDFRVKREEELFTAGSSPVDAIRAELQQLSGVISVTVLHNNTDVTDADGVPPHSVEALVRGGDDQAIFDALWKAVAGGIRTYGTTSGFANDSEGVAQVVQFTRPSEIAIYVDVVCTKDPASYPNDGDDQVSAAIVAWGDSLKTGRDVVARAVSARVFDVDGMLDVTDIDIGTAPNPATDTTITITRRQLAVFDSSRITVVSSNGTP